MEELENITEQDFIDCINKVRNSKITDIAPLGFAGDDLILYENKEKPLTKSGKPVSRSSQLSFRKYCDECELLITDIVGNFLTYSKLNFAFSDEYIAKKFYELFIDLKPYMNKEIESINTEIDFENANYSKGFEILECYIKNKDAKN